MRANIVWGLAGPAKDAASPGTEDARDPETRFLIARAACALMLDLNQGVSGQVIYVQAPGGEPHREERA